MKTKISFDTFTTIYDWTIDNSNLFLLTEKTTSNLSSLELFVYNFENNKTSEAKLVEFNPGDRFKYSSMISTDSKLTSFYVTTTNYFYIFCYNEDGSQQIWNQTTNISGKNILNSPILFNSKLSLFYSIFSIYHSFDNV